MSGHVSKRMADLQVIGFNIEINRQRKDAVTGQLILERHTDEAIAEKISEIVAASKVLAGRGKKIKLNLAAQHPLIRQRSWLT